MKGNNVSITGNLTRDCEVRRTQSGRAVVSFGLCWNGSRKNDRGGYDDVPNYFDVQMWPTDGQLNVVQPQLVKGARCAVTEAHLVYQSWQGQDGNNRSKVVVQVDDPIQGMTVRPPQGGSNGQSQAQYNNYPPQGQNGAYNAPQPAQNGYRQQPNQGYQQQGQQMAVGTSVYDDDIPF